MKTILTICLFCASIVLGNEGRAQSAQASRPVLNPATLEKVPDGNYRLNLETGDGEKLLNLKVQNGEAEVVNASDPALKGMRGQFRRWPQLEGAFTIRLQNAAGTATQMWIFRKDGSAAVREAPDRGELQLAVPVNDNSLKEGAAVRP